MNQEVIVVSDDEEVIQPRTRNWLLPDLLESDDDPVPPEHRAYDSGYETEIIYISDDE